MFWECKNAAGPLSPMALVVDATLTDLPGCCRNRTQANLSLCNYGLLKKHILSM